MGVKKQTRRLSAFNQRLFQQREDPMPEQADRSVIDGNNDGKVENSSDMSGGVS